MKSFYTKKYCLERFKDYVVDGKLKDPKSIGLDGLGTRMGWGDDYVSCYINHFGNKDKSKHCSGILIKKIGDRTVLFNYIGSQYLLPAKFSISDLRKAYKFLLE